MRLPIFAITALAVCSLTSDAQFIGSSPSSVATVLSNTDATVLHDLLSAKRPELIFAVDDVISVQVFGIKEYAAKQRVADDGSIIFPFVGKVPVAGLTVQQLQNVLALSLRQDGIIRDPQVTVSADSRPSAIVTVSGDVAKPGVFPAFGNRTVMDYLSEAGGMDNIQSAGSNTSNSPASSVVTLIRTSLGMPVSIPLGSDPEKSPYGRIPLFPGDEIRVGKVGVIYAVGAFKNQGAYPLKNTSPTTVTQLVGLAGGIGYEAASAGARIVRTTGDSKTLLSVNVAKILKREAPDVALQPDDILFVPTNQMKAAIKGGGTGLIVSLASAYLYTTR